MEGASFFEGNNDCFEINKCENERSLSFEVEDLVEFDDIRLFGNYWRIFEHFYKFSSFFLPAVPITLEGKWLFSLFR